MNLHMSKMNGSIAKHYLIIIIIGISCLCENSIFAQTRVIEHDFSTFTGLNVEDNFDVTIINSDNYSLKITVNESLAEYVRTYVKAQTLYIYLDEKAIPFSVRRMFKGKDAIKPVLKAIVFMPSINSLRLSDASSVSSDSVFETENSFLLDMSGKSSIDNLGIRANSAKLILSKSAMADLGVTSDNIEVDASGDSKLGLKKAGSILSVKSSGSSNVDINGDNEKMTIESSNSSKLNISGTASELEVKCSGSSTVDALGLSADIANVTMTGPGTVIENASSILTMDLSGNSKLVINGDPKIVIVNIKNSSVSHYSKTLEQ